MTSRCSSSPSGSCASGSFPLYGSAAWRASAIGCNIGNESWWVCRRRRRYVKCDLHRHGFFFSFTFLYSQHCRCACLKTSVTLGPSNERRNTTRASCCETWHTHKLSFSHIYPSRLLSSWLKAWACFSLECFISLRQRAQQRAGDIFLPCIIRCISTSEEKERPTARIKEGDYDYGCMATRFGRRLADLASFQASRLESVF